MMDKETFIVGEEVVISSGSYQYKQFVLDKVVKITPTGQIVTKNNFRFNPDGFERSSYHYSRRRIMKSTPERVDSAKRLALQEAVKYKLTAEKIRKMSVNDLEAMLAIIERCEAKP